HGAIAILLLPYHRVDSLYPDPSGPALGKSELDRAGVGQVDDTVRMERTAVVDPHYDAALIIQVGDPDVTGQRQRLVRRSHAVQVGLPAVGGQLAMKLGAVPGGESGLAVAASILDGYIAAPQNRIGRGLERPLMGYRDSVRNLRYIPEIGRGAILHRARDTATVPALHRRRRAGRQQHAQTK